MANLGGPNTQMWFCAVKNKRAPTEAAKINNLRSRSSLSTSTRIYRMKAILVTLLASLMNQWPTMDWLLIKIKSITGVVELPIRLASRTPSQISTILSIVSMIMIRTTYYLSTATKMIQGTTTWLKGTRKIRWNLGAYPKFLKSWRKNQTILSGPLPLV